MKQYISYKTRTEELSSEKFKKLEDWLHYKKYDLYDYNLYIGQMIEYIQVKSDLTRWIVEFEGYEPRDVLWNKIKEIL